MIPKELRQIERTKKHWEKEMRKKKDPIEQAIIPENYDFCKENPDFTICADYVDCVITCKGKYKR